MNFYIKKNPIIVTYSSLYQHSQKIILMCIFFNGGKEPTKAKVLRAHGRHDLAWTGNGTVGLCKMPSLMPAVLRR